MIFIVFMRDFLLYKEFSFTALLYDIIKGFVFIELSWVHSTVYSSTLHYTEFKCFFFSLITVTSQLVTLDIEL